VKTESADFNQADDFAAEYDECVQQYGWFSPEVLFGLMYEFVEPDDLLLDLGIGTGLSAIPFHRAGVQVYGIDGSRKMLEICEAKDVAVELRQHDIRSAPIPYAENSFDHVIACGVFHLIERVDGIFAEAARLMRGRGALAFTVELLDTDRLSEGTLIHDGVLEIKNETSGVVSYRHNHALVENLMSRSGFTTDKALDYVAYRQTDWADERTFRAYVARSRDDQWLAPD
jgi:predicted TPR repeat methyltransferase